VVNHLVIVVPRHHEPERGVQPVVGVGVACSFLYMSMHVGSR
jgi:hypothetical protein